jgi:hypothetical protein
MIQVIPAQDITLSHLAKLLGLTITYDLQFFTEYLSDLLTINDLQR